MKIWVKDDKGEEQEKTRPDFASSYNRVQAIMTVNKPICIEKHDVVEQMGRFTLRDGNKTIALGKIIKYKPAKLTEDNDGLTDEQRRQVEEARKKAAEEKSS